jgi:L-threonylcarbamoyladenylate synthase
MKTVTITEAEKLLMAGEVVAIPTETVYGLAGWIYSEAGLKNIFATKERPFFDPLIVHIDTLEKARSLSSNWTAAHDVLARNCWPGPLTLITKKNEKVNPLITAGLDSVGLRCPNHKDTLDLLARMDGGLAAPSANKFGKTSPTSSAHVFDEFQDTVAILEGGSCQVGIESTVAGITTQEDEFLVEIYRPGFYTADMLEDILQKNNLRGRVRYAQSPVAPGQLEHHYMPKIPLIIVPPGFNWETEKGKIEGPLNKEFLRPKNWRLPTDATLASRELYQNLRQFDQEGFDLILVSKMPHHEQQEWLGIWNRLSKAKTLQL